MVCFNQLLKAIRRQAAKVRRKSRHACENDYALMIKKTFKLEKAWVAIYRDHLGVSYANPQELTPQQTEHAIQRLSNLQGLLEVANQIGRQQRIVDGAIKADRLAHQFSDRHYYFKSRTIAADLYMELAEHAEELSLDEHRSWLRQRSELEQSVAADLRQIS